MYEQKEQGGFSVCDLFGQSDFESAYLVGPELIDAAQKISDRRKSSVENYLESAKILSIVP